MLFHFYLVREFSQAVVDWNLRQIGNCFIINDRWPVENILKVISPAFYNLLIVSDQFVLISTDERGSS